MAVAELVKAQCSLSSNLLQEGEICSLILACSEGSVPQAVFAKLEVWLTARSNKEHKASLQVKT